MLMQELGRIIQEDPNLCAMAMVDKRKYIINKWNKSNRAFIPKYSFTRL